MLEHKRTYFSDADLSSVPQNPLSTRSNTLSRAQHYHLHHRPTFLRQTMSRLCKYEHPTVQPEDFQVHYTGVYILRRFGNVCCIVFRDGFGNGDCTRGEHSDLVLWNEIMLMAASYFPANEV